MATVYFVSSLYGVLTPFRYLTSKTNYAHRVPAVANAYGPPGFSESPFTRFGIYKQFLAIQPRLILRPTVGQPCVPLKLQQPYKLKVLASQQSHLTVSFGFIKRPRKSRANTCTVMPFIHVHCRMSQTAACSLENLVF